MIYVFDCFSGTKIQKYNGNAGLLNKKIQKRRKFCHFRLSNSEKDVSLSV